MGAAGPRTWVAPPLPRLPLLLLLLLLGAATAASSLREPAACPARSFALDGSCRPCHSSCAECDGSENFNCTACLVDRAGKQRFLHKRHCRVACPLGFFAEWSSHRCQDCADNCQVCSSQDFCTRCQAPYHVVRGACEEVQTCEAGQVLDPDTDDCIDCGLGCAGCAPSDPEKCDQCLPGYFLLRARCHRTCPQEMYGDLHTGQCANCGTSCLECVDAETCRTCPHGHLHLREHCVTRCPPKMFVNGSARRCEPCHESCDSCSGPGAEECQSCPRGSVLDAGLCQHLEECTAGEFSDSSTGCHQCSPLCAECFGPAQEQCTSCAEGKFLDEQTTCVSSCPEGFVGSEDTRECEECPEGCRQCVADGAVAAGGSEGLTCEACWQPEDAAIAYYLHLGSCIAECPEHYFESPEEGACVPCDAACATCEGEATACVTCAGGLLLDGGVCRQGCRERYFADADRECQHCPQHCEACTNATACAKCSYLYSLLGGKCYVVCPDGYYEGVDEGRCLRCQESCATCSGPGEDDCERCPPGRPRLYEGRCSEECPRHAFYDAGTGDCQDCDQSCESCTGPTAAECATCASDGGEPDPDTGLCSAEEEEDPAPATPAPPACPPGSYRRGDDGSCVTCDGTCAACRGPSDHDCRSCARGAFLYNGTCLSSCPDGHHPAREDGSCVRCHPACATCRGASAADCTACVSSAYRLNNGHCDFSCPPRHYGDEEASACVPCHASCGDCSGPSPADCLSCPQGSVMLADERRCVEGGCPTYGYFPGHDDTCLTCHRSCRSCSGGGAKDCLTCEWGAELQDGICYPACSENNFFTEEGACKPCDESCLRCTGPVGHDCLECHPHLALNVSERRCLPCCLQGGNDGAECCFCREGTSKCVPPPPVSAGRQVGAPDTQPSGEASLGRKSHAALTALLVLSLMAVGAGAALLLRARAHRKLCWSRTSYEKLGGSSGGGGTAIATTTAKPFHDAERDGVRLRAERGEGRYEHSRFHDDPAESGDDDDDDVVYTSGDGTVYRRYDHGKHLPSSSDSEPEDGAAGAGGDGRLFA
ncbi:uncharacterized protein LOC144931064 [Lampetra fluviatilis]